MSIPGFKDGASTTLGAPIGTADSSLTLASASTFPSSGRIWINVSDTELMQGDISGATVSNLTRAAATYKGVSAAQTHNAGDVILLVAAWGSMQAMFPTKIDEQKPAAAASFTFSSIPQTYQNLQIIFSVRSDNAVNNNDLFLRVNGDAGTNYDGERLLNGAGTNFTGQTQMILGYSPGTLAVANYFARGVIWLPDYISTTRDKEALSQETMSIATGTNYVINATGIWRTTNAAISSITMLAGAGNITGTFSLYGWP